MLETVVLIDDDEGTNFYHQIVISEASFAKNILTFEEADEALAYFKGKQEDFPELVFLDINMPGKDGWDFLDSYRRIEVSKSSSPVIIILSTSLNPDDKKRSETYPEVSGFRSKPLTKDFLSDVNNTFFKRGA